MLGRGRLAPAGVGACALLYCAVRVSPTWAEDDAEALSAARALFADALRDEEAQHFASALEKFERVRAVRDTASIEYRIATCDEGLGRQARAYAAYREAIALGRADGRSEDVVRAATERLRVLSIHVGHLSVRLPDPAPAGAEISLDGARLAPEATSEIVVDPGPHTVTAVAPGAVAFRSDVVVPDGGSVALTVALPARGGGGAAGDVAASASPITAGPSPRLTTGWLLVAGGGALLAGALVSWVLRDEDIASLNRACPGGVCPPGADRGGLESTRDRALVEGPLAGALVAGGVVAGALGAYLVASAPSSSAPPSPSGRGEGGSSRIALAPWIGATSGGVALGGTFR